MSNKISTLKSKKATLIDEMQAYSESDNFTVKGFALLEKDLAGISGQIDAAEKAQSLSASSARPSSLGSEYIDQGKFKNLGENLQAIVKAARGNGIDARLKAPTGMGETDPQYGGYTIQPELAHEIITRIYENNVITEKVWRLPVGEFANGVRLPIVNETSRATGSRFGGIQTYWVDEGTQPTVTQPKLKMLELNLHKLMGVWYVTDEMMQDNVLLSGLAQEAFALELNWMLANAITQGTGVGEPLGFLNSAGLVTQSAQKAQASGTIQYQNITGMFSQMFAPSLKNAVWLVHQSTLPQLMSLSLPVGTGGLPMWQPANFAAGAPQETLLGKPVHVVEQLPALGTQGCVCFVDLSAYVVAEKLAAQFASSIHVAFLTDQQVFRVTYRVDGSPLFNAPVTSAYGNIQMSSYIALAGI